MYKAIIKKIKIILLLLTISTRISFAENSLPNTSSPGSAQYCMMGTIATIIFSALLYNYHKVHITTYKQFIENCSLLCQKIYQDVECYHALCQNNIHITDWDLKEIMCAYHTLQKHLFTLNNQLITIDTYNKQLRYKKKSAITQLLQKTLLQLKAQGIRIQKYALQTITLIGMLKNKIQRHQKLMHLINKNVIYHISINRIM